MPELPEIETTLRGLAPHLTGKTVTEIVIRNAKLRWPQSQSAIALRSTVKLENSRTGSSSLSVPTAT